MSSYIEEYYNLISTGKILANKRVIKEYSKMIPIIKGEDSKYYYNHKLAEKPIEFAEKFCKQSKDKWVGNPVNYLLWQKAMFSALFGIVERETDKRKYTDLFLLVAKKNGKTTGLAPIILYLLLQKGHEIYSAANGLAQANIIYNETDNMLNQSNLLQSRLRKRQFKIENMTKGNFSTFRALANNPSKLDGKMPTVVILDEVHELYQNLYGILKRGQISVAEPLFLMVTTKGFVREGLFDEQYQAACKYVDGSLKNEHQLSLLYEFDDPNDFYDEDCWIKANPSLGSIVTIEQLRKQVADAKAMPKLMNEVRTKHFNLGGASATTYFELDMFRNNDRFDLKKFKGEHAIGGFDLSRTNDLTSFSTMLWDRKLKRYCVETMYWISENYYKRVLNDGRLSTSYRAWVEQGYIRIAGVNEIDYTAIIDYVNEMVKKYGIVYRWIYYDSYAATYLVNDFDKNGYKAGVCLIPAIQGFKTLSVPFQLLTAELNNRNICYNDNPVTEWCISNVGVDVDRNGNELPKKADGKNEMKIDGFATILNCFVGIVAHRSEFIY